MSTARAEMLHYPLIPGQIQIMAQFLELRTQEDTLRHLSHREKLLGVVGCKSERANHQRQGWQLDRSAWGWALLHPAQDSSGLQGSSCRAGVLQEHRLLPLTHLQDALHFQMQFSSEAEEKPVFICLQFVLLLLQKG